MENLLIISACDCKPNNGVYPLNLGWLPYQFAEIGPGGKTILQTTVERYLPFVGSPERIIVVINNKLYCAAVAEQLSKYGVPPENVRIAERKYGYPSAPLYGRAKGLACGAEYAWEKHKHALAMCVFPDRLLSLSQEADAAILESLEESTRGGGAPIMISMPHTDTPEGLEDMGYVLCSDERTYRCIDRYRYYEQDASEAYIKKAGSCVGDSGILVCPVEKLYRATRFTEGTLFRTKELMNQHLIGPTKYNLVASPIIPSIHYCNSYKGLHECYAQGDKNNALLGSGAKLIDDSVNSLFYANKGVELTVENMNGELVVIYRYGDKLFYLIGALSGSRDYIVELARIFESLKGSNYQLNACNNFVRVDPSVKMEVFGAFVGVEGRTLLLRDDEGVLKASASKLLVPLSVRREG